MRWFYYIYLLTRQNSRMRSRKRKKQEDKIFLGRNPKIITLENNKGISKIYRCSKINEKNKFNRNLVTNQISSKGRRQGLRAREGLTISI